jgi:hypothetical protein
VEQRLEVEEKSVSVLRYAHLTASFPKWFELVVRFCYIDGGHGQRVRAAVPSPATSHSLVSLGMVAMADDDMEDSNSSPPAARARAATTMRRRRWTKTTTGAAAAWRETSAAATER